MKMYSEDNKNTKTVYHEGNHCEQKKRSVVWCDNMAQMNAYSKKQIPQRKHLIICML